MEKNKIKTKKNSSLYIKFNFETKMSYKLCGLVENNILKEN